MSNDTNSSLESQALSAIQNEALKLLANPLSPEIEKAIALIESIARYGLDVRSEQEKRESTST